jgi:hypothetical protein
MLDAETSPLFEASRHGYTGMLLLFEIKDRKQSVHAATSTRPPSYVHFLVS